MRFLPAGREALLVECADAAEVIGLHRAVAADRPDGVTEVVPAARSLLVMFDHEVTGAERVTTHLRRLRPAPATHSGSAVVDIAVAYDGVDLAEVAELTGLTEPEVVRRHVAGDYVVAFCGFAPGFAYLVGADPALTVPRRETPRTRVPAGSVALAGEFTGVYPRESPGGWQLVGRTGSSLWDLDRDPPALLSPGTRVRFVRVDP